MKLLLLAIIMLISNLELAFSQSGELPDNGLIVFVSEVDGDAEIYTIHADGTGLYQLTANEDFDYYPTWSPDGSQIAYAHERQLYIINADGSDNSPVANIDVTGAMSWSSDGSKLVFESSGDIVVLDVNSLATINLTNTFDEFDSSPTWSPDGSQIAYVSSGDNPIPSPLDGEPRLDIYIMDVDGSNRVKLPIGNRGITALGSLNWRSDDTIIYSARLAAQVFSIRISDGAIIPLTDLTIASSFPDVSPDEQQIVFIQGNQLAIMDADGSNPVVITDTPENKLHPNWQPVIPAQSFLQDTRFVQWNSDGSLIATVSDNNLIEIKDASDLQTVYSLQYEAFVSVDWHPTDPKLLAIAPREHGRIETRNVETGGLVSSITVYAISQDIYTIQWSPDGSLLAAGMGASGSGASAELRIWDVSSRTLLFSSGAGLRYIYDIKWSHDGTLLATQTGGDNVQFVTIWDISDQSEIASLYGDTYEDEQGFDTVEPIILGDWHPITNEMATVQSLDLQLRDGATFQPIKSNLILPTIYDMAWSPNGDMIALTGIGEISFLASETFTIFSTIVTESSDSIRSISWSRTTNQIVFAQDRNGIQIITPPSR